MSCERDSLVMSVILGVSPTYFVVWRHGTDKPLFEFFVFSVSVSCRPKRSPDGDDGTPLKSTMFSGRKVNRLVQRVAEEAEEAMVSIAERLGSPTLMRRQTSNDTSFESETESESGDSEDEVAIGEDTQVAFVEYMQELPVVDLDKVALTLESCAENFLLVEDKDHYNILHKSIILNHKKLFNLLLNSGCDVNYTIGKRCSVSSKCRHPQLGNLHLACFLGRENFVTALIERGADVRAKKRVYTSALLNCSAELQPGVFALGEPTQVVEWTNNCGLREPAYFAVLGDHVTILKQLFNLIRPHKETEYLNLLPLSCRIGAYKCLEFLLHEYPQAVNRLDSDGMPPLLMAMKHGLKFVSLLLRAGADVAIMEDLWQPGVNILHFLFEFLPIPDQSTKKMCNIIDEFIKRGANVNSRGQFSLETPLHVLARAVNSFWSFDLDHLERNAFPAIKCQTEYEDTLIEVMAHLITKDCDVNIRDCRGNTALHLLCSNGRHILRYRLCRSALVRAEVRQMLGSRSCGLENIVRACGIILNHPGFNASKLHRPTPQTMLVRTLLNFEPHRDARQLPIGLSSIDVLSSPDVTSCYIRLMRLIGGDVNAHTKDGLSPLLMLWSSLRDRSTLGKILYTESVATALCDLSTVLLDLGAATECKTMYFHQEKRTIGVFDFLLIILQDLQENYLTRKTSELRVLRHFVQMFIQYGSHTVVHRDLLYGHSADDSIPDAPWCNYLPEHSFLFQVLQFGALNLQYVAQGPYYAELCELLLNEINQYTLSEVVNTVYVRFMAMHEPLSCCCGQCAVFTAILERYHRKPKSLKQICRNAILNNIEVLSPAKVHCLHLPTPLSQYLLYRDIIMD